MKNLYIFNKLMNSPRILFKRALAIGGGIMLMSTVALAQQVSPGTAPMTPPPGGFGIDGDLKAFFKTFPNPEVVSLAGDWLPHDSAIPNGGVLQANGDTIPNLPKPFKAYHFVDQFSTGDDIFSGGEKKNTYVQNVTWKNGNPSPAKCDINHFMMHIAKDVSNDVWIVLAGDREEVTGNSFISLQFLQKKLEQVSTPTKKFISDAPNSTGGRTVGDLQISAEFTGGGGNPNLYLERWELVGNVYKWVSKSYSPGDALGAVNTGVLTNNAYSMFNRNTYQPNAFVEVAVNISDIIEDVSGQECFGKISTLWVQTKTSQSESAALTDFVTPIQVNLDINIDLAAEDPDPVCDGSIDLADAITSDKTGLTFEYFNADPAGNPAPTPLASSEVTTSGTYYIKASSGSGSLCNDVVSVTVSIGIKPAMPVVELLPSELCGARSAPALKILCPIAGTYTVSQPGEDDITFEYPGNGNIIENLVGGKTFSIVVTSEDGCTSDATDCTNYDDEEHVCADTRQAAPATNPQIGSVNEQQIKAFPVPFSDKVTVEFKSKKAENYVINLYDMQGRLVKQLKTGNAQAGEVTRFEIDGKGMIDSMYLVRKVSKSGVETVKLLKKE